VQDNIRYCQFTVKVAYDLDSTSTASRATTTTTTTTTTSMTRTTTTSVRENSTATDSSMPRSELSSTTLNAGSSSLSEGSYVLKLIISLLLRPWAGMSLRAYASIAKPASSQQNSLLLTSLLLLSDVLNVKNLPSSRTRYQVFWP